MRSEDVATIIDEAAAGAPEAAGALEPEWPVKAPEPEFPPPPETLEEAGVSTAAAMDLILKMLYSRGAQPGGTISSVLALSFALLDDVLLSLQQMQLVEVRGTKGHGREGYTFALTQAGIVRAREAMELNGYVGPAPVPLPVFREWVGRQSEKGNHVSRQMLADAFADLVLKPEVIDMVGPAVNSASSMFLHGAPGNGKTAMAERIARIASDTVFIPHAIEVNGEIVLLFDPVHHRTVDEDDDAPAHRILRNRAAHDPRFVKIRRPAVVVGGELTLDQLDLQRDRDTKVYHAPFQLKAIHGVLIVDDFGRQRMQPHELLNRWIVPLEKGIDYLSLSTGIKFSVPFDCLPIFSTNLDPVDLVDEAFLRRIRFKIEVGDPTRAEYAEILEDVCRERGIDCEEGVVSFLFSKYHDGLGIPPRCCHPRDLVDQVEAAAQFADVEPHVTKETVDLAAQTYFMITARSLAERAPGGGIDP